MTWTDPARDDIAAYDPEDLRTAADVADMVDRADTRRDER